MGTEGTSNLIPSVRKGDKTTLYLYGRENATVRASWVSGNGLISLGTFDIRGQQVSAIDLGSVPSGVSGIQLDSDDVFLAQAKVTANGGDGQEDFALLPAVAPEKRSAIALPDGYDLSLTLANTSNAKTTATVAFMNDDGSMRQGKQVTIKANSAMTMDTQGVAAVVACKDDTVAWGLRLDPTRWRARRSPACPRSGRPSLGCAWRVSPRPTACHWCASRWKAEGVIAGIIETRAPASLNAGAHVFIQG